MTGGPKAPLENTAPLITVITSVFNGAQTLQATIDSLRLQTFRDFEYVVVDGASNDGTVGLLHANADHIDSWVSEPEEGIYNALNKGLDLGRG